MNPEISQPNLDPGEPSSPGGLPAQPGNIVAPGSPFPDGIPPSPVLPSTVYTPQPGTTSPSIPLGQADLPTTPFNTPIPKKSRFRPRRPKLVILVALVLILLGGSATAAYFGYYVPNKPENLWRTALTNTGKGYDKLSDYVTKTKSSKGYALNGSFRSSGGLAADGSLTGNSNGKDGQITGNISTAGVKINFDIREIASSSNTPDIYFKFDGLQGIGSLFGGGNPALSSALNGLNGQWYFVDHTLFDQFAQGANTNLQITSDDLNSILKAVGDASKKYLFTSDTSKMAVTVKQEVGEETQDGRNVYHYKVGLNKQNLLAYTDALCANLKASKLNKFFGGNADAVNTALDCQNNKKDIEKTDYSQTADAWVDKQTKLIHKVRISAKNKADNYFEIGQNYTGGDNFPFSLSVHSKDGGTTINTNIKLVFNMKTNSVNLSGDFSESGDSKTNASFSLGVKPSNTPVKVEKPASSKTFIELLNNLGFGGLFSGTAGPI